MLSPFHLTSSVSITGAVALGALHVDVGHEPHVDFLVAVPLTGLAAPLFGVEAEVARLERPRLRFGRLSKQQANRIERLHVGHRIRTGRPANRTLVDPEGVFDLTGADEIVELRGFIGFDP